MSPLGPLLQVTCGKAGQPKLEVDCVGVSVTKSEPQEASPQIWRRFNQWPTSCVAVLPKFFFC